MINFNVTEWNMYTKYYKYTHKFYMYSDGKYQDGSESIRSFTIKQEDISNIFVRGYEHYTVVIVDTNYGISYEFWGNQATAQELENRILLYMY